MVCLLLLEWLLWFVDYLACCFVDCAVVVCFDVRSFDTCDLVAVGLLGLDVYCLICSGLWLLFGLLCGLMFVYDVVILVLVVFWVLGLVFCVCVCDFAVFLVS